MVEFVSYNGAYPSLCCGELVIRINGKEINLGSCLMSNGRAGIDYLNGEFVEKGEWSVIVPEQYESYKRQIEEVVNNNVPYGCCGGCI